MLQRPIYTASQYSPRVIGAPNTLEYRVFIEHNGQVVSAMHDIPLWADANQTILNMVVEIPRWTNAKMVISNEPLNPIKQDTRKGKLRWIRHCFPHHGYIWNYGAFPQTWGDPAQIHSETAGKGDNDPLDVCEIGEQVGYVGQVKQVKPLGVVALLNDGIVDFKIIVIDIQDPNASECNDIEDMQRLFPGYMYATREWLRMYKLPEYKPENQFAFGGKPMNRKYALDIIREAHESWERVVRDDSEAAHYGIAIRNVTLHDSVGYTRRDDPVYMGIPPASPKPPAPVDSSISKWFHISAAQV